MSSRRNFGSPPFLPEDQAKVARLPSSANVIGVAMGEQDGADLVGVVAGLGQAVHAATPAVQDRGVTVDIDEQRAPAATLAPVSWVICWPPWGPSTTIFVLPRDTTGC